MAGAIIAFPRSFVLQVLCFAERPCQDPVAALKKVDQMLRPPALRPESSVESNQPKLRDLDAVAFVKKEPELENVVVPREQEAWEEGAGQAEESEQFLLGNQQDRQHGGGRGRGKGPRKGRGKQSKESVDADLENSEPTRKTKKNENKSKGRERKSSARVEEASACSKPGNKRKAKGTTKSEPASKKTRGKGGKKHDKEDCDGPSDSKDTQPQSSRKRTCDPEREKLRNTIQEYEHCKVIPYWTRDAVGLQLKIPDQRKTPQAELCSRV